MNQRTRSLLPDTYEEIKQKMIDEYGQIMTRKPLLNLKVIRGEDTRKGAEASFKAEEGGCHAASITITSFLWRRTRSTIKRRLRTGRGSFQILWGLI